MADSHGVSALLVAMPMAAIARPSIQLGLLAAIAGERGHRVDTLHACLDFGALVLEEFEPERSGSERTERILSGSDVYSELSDLWSLVGDWLFSVEAFGDRAPDPDGLHGRESLEAFGDSGIGLDDLSRIRQALVPRFLDRLMEDVAWSDYDLVGFTSTFQQQVASVALAARIKAVHPGVRILFGGANLDGEMGLEHVRTAESIDLVLRGEADETFPALLTALAEGADLSSVPGLIHRAGGSVLVNRPSDVVPDLARAPVPEYGEFFRRAADLGLIPLEESRRVDLPFESARGCWWGQRVHCTFCGLNGDTMAFRSKPADRVVSELETLAARHGSRRMSAVDNIVDRAYLDDLFPRLEEMGAPFDLFYEVKADLSPAQLSTMRRGGVTRIQPGIESLDSRILGLMRKGTRSSWNVNLLRWCRHLGIDVAWNLLWGFPGETIDDYRAQEELVPSLLHLQPPSGFSRVILERFSPLFTGATPGVADFRATEHYRRVYPAGTHLDRIAYFFEYEAVPVLEEQDLEPLKSALRLWADRWASDSTPGLVRYRTPRGIRIEDSRDPARAGVHTLEGPAAIIHDLCMDRPRTPGQVAEELDVAPGPVAAVLDGLVGTGLLMRDRSLYLSLALPEPGPV